MTDDVLPSIRKEYQQIEHSGLIQSNSFHSADANSSAHRAVGSSPGDVRSQNSPSTQLTILRDNLILLFRALGSVRLSRPFLFPRASLNPPNPISPPGNNRINIRKLLMVSMSSPSAEALDRHSRWLTSRAPQQVSMFKMRRLRRAPIAYAAALQTSSDRGIAPRHQNSSHSFPRIAFGFGGCNDNFPRFSAPTSCKCFVLYVRFNSH